MFKTSVIYFLIRAVNGVLGLATVFILTRLMSADQYGAYALGMASIGLCASVLYQWIAVTIARFYSAHIDNPGILITEGKKLFFGVSVGALVAMTVYIVIAKVDGAKLNLTLAVAIGVVAIGLHNIGLQIANASGKPLNYGLLTVSRAAFALCAAVGLVKLGYGSTGAVFGVAIGGVLSVAIFRIRQVKKQGKNSKQLRKEMIVYGLPLTMTYLSTMILDVSDRFMIGWWLGTPAVAGYAAAYDLTQQVIGAIMNVLFLATYPRIVAAWESAGAPAARLAMLPLSKSMLLGMPLLAGIFIGGATEISNLGLGKAIASDAAKIIPWIAFAITIGCFKSYYLDIAFQLTKTTKIQLYITMTMAFANVVLNFCLMPYFGVVGAAIATAAAFLLGASLSWWFGKSLNVYSARTFDVAKMATVFFLVVIGMYFSPESGYGVIFDVFVSLTLGCAAYLAGALITNLGDLRSILKKSVSFLIN